MATNPTIVRRPTDRDLFLAAAIVFPLLVLIGYFKTYYFMNFFDAIPIASALVHAHGVVMTIWVIYFVSQVYLIRSKNVKLHMTMGMAGVALAAIVVIVGMATAYDFSLVRKVSPGGMNPYGFFIFPFGDMVMFVLFFAGAIYFRKRPAEHKSLMLMTAINFLPAAISRIPLFPEAYAFEWAFGLASAMALIALIWHTIKHGKLNRIFATAVMMFTVVNILRFPFAESEVWLRFVGAFAP